MALHARAQRLTSMASGVHKRKGRDGAKTQEFSSDCATDCKDVTVDKDEKPSTEAKLEAGSYWLTRIVFIRALGFVYCKFVYAAAKH